MSSPFAGVRLAPALTTVAEASSTIVQQCFKGKDAGRENSEDGSDGENEDSAPEVKKHVQQHNERDADDSPESRSDENCSSGGSGSGKVAGGGPIVEYSGSVQKRRKRRKRKGGADVDAGSPIVSFDSADLSNNKKRTDAIRRMFDASSMAALPLGASPGAAATGHQIAGSGLFDGGAISGDVLGLERNERLVYEFSCALLSNRMLLVHGRLYVFEKHLLFYSSLFGYRTRLILSLKDTTIIARYAKPLPAGAIEITTLSGKTFVFASILFVDSVLSFVQSVWCHSSNYAKLSLGDNYAQIKSIYTEHMARDQNQEQHGRMNDDISRTAVEEQISSPGGERRRAQSMPYRQTQTSRESMDEAQPRPSVRVTFDDACLTSAYVGVPDGKADVDNDNTGKKVGRHTRSSSLDIRSTDSLSDADSGRSRSAPTGRASRRSATIISYSGTEVDRPTATDSPPKLQRMNAFRLSDKKWEDGLVQSGLLGVSADADADADAAFDGNGSEHPVAGDSGRPVAGGSAESAHETTETAEDALDSARIDALGGVVDVNGPENAEAAAADDVLNIEPAAERQSPARPGPDGDGTFPLGVYDVDEDALLAPMVSGEIIPASLSEIFDCCMADTETAKRFVVEWRSSRGDVDIEVGDWERHVSEADPDDPEGAATRGPRAPARQAVPDVSVDQGSAEGAASVAQSLEPAAYERDVRFRSLTHASWGPKYATCRERARYSIAKLSPEGQEGDGGLQSAALRMDIVQHMLDIPFGDTFEVHQVMKFTEYTENAPSPGREAAVWTVADVLFRVHFTKKTMWSSTIERSATDQSRLSVATYLEAIRAVMCLSRIGADDPEPSSTPRELPESGVDMEAIRAFLRKNDVSNEHRENIKKMLKLDSFRDLLSAEGSSRDSSRTPSWRRADIPLKRSFDFASFVQASIDAAAAMPSRMARATASLCESATSAIQRRMELSILISFVLTAIVLVVAVFSALESRRELRLLRSDIERLTRRSDRYALSHSVCLPTFA